MATGLTYLQQASDASNLTTYTFASQSLGATAADRRIVVCVGAWRASGALSVSSVTVGGVSAALVSTDGGSDRWRTEIWIAEVPTGTTGDVVVTLAAAGIRCSVDLFRLVDADFTAAADADGNVAQNPSVTLDVPAGGCAVGVVNSGWSTNAGTVSWAGLTEQSDAQVETFVRASAAGDNFASQQTGLAITCTTSGTVTHSGTSGAFASWGPAAAGGGTGVTAVRLAGSPARLAGGGGLAG